jgi:hypothetical protein
MSTSVFVILAVFVVLFKNPEGCQNKHSIRVIHGANVLYHIPVINQDGSKTDINNSYDVYYLGELSLYRFNYQRDSVIDGELKLSETRYFFFVHHLDSTFGYVFDPFGIYPESREKVDSMRIYRFENPKWDTIARMKADSNYINDKGDLVKVYKLPPTKKYPGSFTYYFYYTNRLKDIRESFSKKLEAIHNKKLYRIRMVVHPVYYEPYKRMLPEVESYYEMKEIQVSNSEEIKGYFHKYKKIITRE